MNALVSEKYNQERINVLLCQHRLPFLSLLGFLPRHIKPSLGFGVLEKHQEA